MSTLQRAGDSNRLRSLLGIEHPVIQGPFGGGLSSVELAAVVSEAGGLGSYGANITPPEGIPELVRQLRARTERPFAVNLWVPLPGEKDARLTDDEFAVHVQRLLPYFERLGVTPPEHLPPTPNFQDQAEALLAARPPVISFVMGVPPREVLDEANRLGIVTMGTATTVEEAQALDEAGLDAIVASGSDGGGHRGSFLRPVRESLVGTFSLVPQVADAVSVPVVAAGGIADGRGAAAALTLGADGVQIGTAFLATDESGASDVHKEVLHSPAAGTTMLTRLFSGRHARAIPNRLMREMEPYEEAVPAYPAQNALMLPIRRASGAQGLPDYVNLWAGQAAPLVPRGTAAQYLKMLLAEMTEILGSAAV
ncbi:NAD(P)H-dependent flavin oxidoreductase [Streptomyces flaveolus]|uniref:NAD(P)H-dependent flavin oxidoreductase n=1 Tax=Streptomyces flaveolus TaxID=67297 RepID=UPI0036FE6407